MTEEEKDQWIAALEGNVKYLKEKLEACSKENYSLRKEKYADKMVAGDLSHDDIIVS